MSWLSRLAFLAAACVDFGCSGSPERPNVLLVTLDTTRADRIGCYGARPSPTPSLDRLAQEGVVFEAARTPVPITLPSHSTMMTGLLPPRHGVRNNGSYVLPPGVETLAERFRAGGYRTGGFVSAYVLQRQFGIARGFEAYDDSLYNERSGVETAQRAVSWLGRDDRRPFFCWVHLFDAHTPWAPPPAYNRPELASGYEREIAAADGALAEVIAALERARLLDRTLVVVLADHGEGLGDHGEAEHGIFLYGETTHIPWVLRLPRAEKKGTRIRELVSTIDLAPSLLEWCELPPLPDIDGISWVPLIRGGTRATRHGLYSETLYPKENFGWSPLLAFETDRWKWIRAPERELYALPVDREELDNRAAALPDTAARLDRRLERLSQNLTPKVALARSNVSPEVEERLRSLGYLSGGALTGVADPEAPDPKRMIASHGDFEEAKRAMDDGRFHDALAPFRRVLAREERNRVALLGFGIAATKTSHHAEAETALRRVIELSPGNTTAMVALADAMFGQERFRDALELYRLGAHDRTQARHVRTRSASCLWKLGREAEARALLQSAPPTDAPFARELERRLDVYKQTLGAPATLEAVRAAAGAGFSAEAERALTRPRIPAEEEAARLDLLATLFEETGQPERALVTLEQLITRFGATPERGVWRASFLLGLSRTSEALAAYDALDRAKLTTAALAIVDYNRACALAREGRVTDALLAIRHAVRNGYRRADRLLNDPDLVPLRSVEGFQALVDSVRTLERAAS